MIPLALLSRLPWKWIGLVLALVALVLAIDHRGYQRGYHKRDAQIAALQASIANLEAASAQAHADNLAHVAAVEKHDAQITKEQTDALSHQIVDARAAADRYIRLHAYAPADRGNAGGGDLSQTSDPAAAAAPADQAPVVVDAGDVRACTDAVTTAEGWQAWWAAVSVAPR